MGDVLMKCKHSYADKVKPGSATTQVMSCPKCKKIIIKGKNTGKGFGIAKVLRTKEHGKGFVIKGE